MTSIEKKITFLITEDDDDDFLVIQKSFNNPGTRDCTMVRVTDGEALLSFLHAYHHTDGASDKTQSFVILLDLNMPRVDGRQVLKEIKSDPHLKHIPVVIFTTSKASEDVRLCYELGANAYFIKPSNFDTFRDVMQLVRQHWIRSATLPSL